MTHPLRGKTHFARRGKVRYSHQAFGRAILEKPKDQMPSLVYADWLEENGMPTYAGIVRHHIARQGEGGWGPHYIASGDGRAAIDDDAMSTPGQPVANSEWVSPTHGNLVYVTQYEHNPQTGRPHGYYFSQAVKDNRDALRLLDRLESEGVRVHARAFTGLDTPATGRRRFARNEDYNRLFAEAARQFHESLPPERRAAHEPALAKFLGLDHFGVIKNLVRGDADRAHDVAVKLLYGGKGGASPLFGNHDPDKSGLGGRFLQLARWTAARVRRETLGHRKRRVGGKDVWQAEVPLSVVGSGSSAGREGGREAEPPGRAVSQELLIPASRPLSESRATPEARHRVFRDLLLAAATAAGPRGVNRRELMNTKGLNAGRHWQTLLDTIASLVAEGKLAEREQGTSRGGRTSKRLYAPEHDPGDVPDPRHARDAAILEGHAAGVAVNELARRHGVSRGLVQKIIRQAKARKLSRRPVLPAALRLRLSRSERRHRRLRYAAGDPDRPYAAHVVTYRHRDTGRLTDHFVFTADGPWEAIEQLRRGGHEPVGVRPAETAEFHAHYPHTIPGASSPVPPPRARPVGPKTQVDYTPGAEPPLPVARPVKPPVAKPVAKFIPREQAPPAAARPVPNQELRQHSVLSLDADGRPHLHTLAARDATHAAEVFGQKVRGHQILGITEGPPGPGATRTVGKPKRLARRGAPRRLSRADHIAHIRAIAADLDDHMPRLTYADRLEEHGLSAVPDALRRSAQPTPLDTPGPVPGRPSESWVGGGATQRYATPDGYSFLVQLTPHIKGGRPVVGIGSQVYVSEFEKPPVPVGYYTLIPDYHTADPDLVRRLLGEGQPYEDYYGTGTASDADRRRRLLDHVAWMEGGPRPQRLSRPVRFSREDETAFHRAIHDRPHDQMPALAYSDWLEENGKPHHAEAIRRGTRFWLRRTNGHRATDTGETRWDRPPGTVFVSADSFDSRGRTRDDSGNPQASAWVWINPLSHPGSRLFYRFDAPREDVERVLAGMHAEGAEIKTNAVWNPPRDQGGEPERLSAYRAPAGGMIVRGQYFQGGMMVPDLQTFGSPGNAARGRIRAALAAARRKKGNKPLATAKAFALD